MNMTPMVFDYDNLNVRVVTDESGELLFVGRDVAEVLGYAKPQNAIAAHCRGALKRGIPSAGGIQVMTVIPERDVYRLIMRSTLPSAEKFEEWVVGELLPTIRKHGRYAMPGAAVVDQTPVNVPFEIQVAESAARMLRMSETSRVRMLATLCEERGISTAFLPAYVDEALTEALGDLLKKHGSTLSARAVNPMLIEMGLLEERERRASRGGVKQFKSLTDAGLAFGKNEACPRNPNETQPRYYVKAFPRLLDEINAWMRDEDRAA